MSPDVITIALRAAVIVIFIVLACELSFGNGNNVLLMRLRDLWIAVAVVYVFPLVNAIEHYIDVSPGFTFSTVAKNSLWAAYIYVLVVQVRFWWTFRTLHRRKEKP